MSAPLESISLIDQSPSDPDDLIAARYMWHILDEEIAAREDAARPEKPDKDTSALLVARYGSIAAQAKRTAGQSWVDAVKVLVHQKEKPLLPNHPAYVLPWTRERADVAVRWFQERLRSVWPSGDELRFLAEDLPTLWAACHAMDLAPVRKTAFADDPFPAQPVLITGATGTGKVLAKAMHRRSDRKGFGALNCGGLPPELLESELFGHVKGAFTGAIHNKTGFVETYQEGTLFLDEIGDMPGTVQVRLLRFLNDGEFRRVGDVTSGRSTPRIISATHVDLEARVKAREFREDLFYRIRGHRVRLRALKERPAASNKVLIERFLGDASKSRGKDLPSLTRRAWRALVAYEWPGNMRELKYVAEQIIDANDKRTILDLDELPGEIRRTYHQAVPRAEQDVLAASAARERGDSTKATVMLYADIGLHFREETQRPDSRAAALTRTANLVERLASRFGVEALAEFHVRALRAASSETLCREFQERWLVPLTKHAEEHSCDISQAIDIWNSSSNEQAKKSKEERVALQLKIDETSQRYAVASAIATIAGIVESGEIPYIGKLLSALEQGMALAEAPPLNAGVKYLVEEIKDLSPEAIKTKLKEAFEDQDDSEEDDLKGPIILNATLIPTWDQAKNDLPLLTKIIEQHGGNKSKAADKLGVRPRTLYKALEILEKNAQGQPDAAGSARAPAKATSKKSAKNPRDRR